LDGDSGWGPDLRLVHGKFEFDRFLVIEVILQRTIHLRVRQTELGANLLRRDDPFLV
jgi:hypothetical protein